MDAKVKVRENRLTKDTATMTAGVGVESGDGVAKEIPRRADRR